MRQRPTALAAALVLPAALAAAAAGRPAREAAGIPFAPGRAVSVLDVDRAGLVSHFPFDGDFLDASGGGAASPGGGARLSEDRFARLSSACDVPPGGSISFARPVELGPRFSFAAFLLLRQGATGYRPLLTTTGSAKIFQVLFDTGRDELRITNGTTPIRSATVHLPRDRWFHLAVAFDGAAAVTYVDGAAVDTFAYALDIAAGPHVVLGALPTDPRYSWDGAYDEVRLYTRGLLAAEVAALATEPMCAASRTLADYAPSVPVVVPIRVAVPKTTATWSLDEEVPATFAVTDVDSGGRWDQAAQKVVWGPFTDAAARTVRYTVTPPAGTTGKKSFRGAVLLDGQSLTTCGDTEMSSGQVHPADLSNDMKLGAAEVAAYAESWRTGTTWSLAPNPIPVTYVTNAGFILKTGETYRYDATASPPFVPSATGAPTYVPGTAVSSFDPCAYAAGGTVKVTLVVTPPASAKAWAIEDAAPSGWTVSDLDSEGSHDATGKKVKWGPFYDAASRTLTYKARAGALDAGKRLFAGTVSFDGASTAVTGSREIDSAGCGSSGHEYWTPAVVHAAGAEGSLWQSDLSIVNRSDVVASVEARIFTGSTGQALTRTLQPGTQLVVLDIWSQLFSTDGAGPLRVTSDQPLAVANRTFNTGTAGTFGAAYPTLPPDQWLKQGDTAILPALREDALFRTNLGFANGGPTDAALTVTLLDASGLAVTQYLVTLAPGEFYQDQQPFYTRGGQTGIVSGYAKVAVQTGSAVMAFASVIDNRTNDPTAVAPVK